MVGVILILLLMFVAGPIGLFLTGAIWSAVHGWLESAAADDRQQATEPATG